MKNNVMSAALAAAVLGAAGTATAGQYLSGDFHNHTTCSDGSTSVKTLTRKSLEYLDWFIQVGHSGRGSRDCRISDFLYMNRDSDAGTGLWVNSLPGGAADIKGDIRYETMRNGGQVQTMWRWQSLQEFQVPSIVEERNLPANEGKTAFLGLEWVVPGHEHTSASISNGQYGEEPNADALAQFEYCFASNSDDTSMGGGQGWTCELSAESNNKLKALFEGRPEEGPADYNATLVGGVNTADTGDHVKSTAGVMWMQENFPGESFAVQSHIERQGPFTPGSNRGYNIEHIRDWNSMAPEVAFGFESEPGHQSSGGRGGYSTSRPTAGFYTFGGTGCYAGAEAAKPGYHFDGTPITAADFLAGGEFEELSDSTDPARVTACRPGIRTMWDALLSEGRKFWYFASSDWHNRGSFGPLDFETTGDFWPGEYQKQYVWLEDGEEDEAKAVVDALRSGNSFAVRGDLIKGDLEFKACAGHRCATMGETLKVRKGQMVWVVLELTDPEGANNSQYKFDNPALLQIGKRVPLNEPELAQVDLIMGAVNGLVEPTDANYYNPLAPASTHIARTWTDFGKRWGHKHKRDQRSKLMHLFKASGDSYIRARGSNLPAGTPHMRDMDGNPLRDDLAANIPCEDAACPTHINGVLNYDVEAWADLTFHTNPIFIEVVND